MANGLALGDLVATIGLDSRNYDRGLERAAKSQKKFAKEAQATGQLMSGRFKSSLTQAAFAADDFFGVLQNSGDVSAALRATSNNIGTLVTSINPLAGIATTVGLALGTALIPRLFETGEAAKKAREELKKLIEQEQDRDRDFIDRGVDRRRRERELRESDNPELIRRQRERDRRAEEARRRLDAVTRQIAALPGLEEVPTSNRQSVPIPIIGGAIESVRSGFGLLDNEDERREIVARNEERRRARAALGSRRAEIRNEIIRLESRDIAGTIRRERAAEAAETFKRELSRQANALPIRAAFGGLFGGGLFSGGALQPEPAGAAAERLERIEAARKKSEQRAVTRDAEPGQLAGFLQRGSVEAASAINRASATARDNKLEEKKIVSNTMKTAEATVKIAAALAGAGGVPIFGVVENLGQN